MIWVEAYSSTGAPAAARDLGDGMYGIWLERDQQSALISWIAASPERYKASVYEQRDPDLPQYAVIERVADLTAGQLEALTDEEFKKVRLAIFEVDDADFTNANVVAIRTEAKRRFGV